MPGVCLTGVHQWWRVNRAKMDVVIRRAAASALPGQPGSAKGAASIDRVNCHRWRWCHRCDKLNVRSSVVWSNPRLGKRPISTRVGQFIIWICIAVAKTKILALAGCKIILPENLDALIPIPGEGLGKRQLLPAGILESHITRVNQAEPCVIRIHGSSRRVGSSSGVSHEHKLVAKPTVRNRIMHIEPDPRESGCRTQSSGVDLRCGEDHFAPAVIVVSVNRGLVERRSSLSDLINLRPYTQRDQGKKKNNHPLFHP